LIINIVQDDEEEANGIEGSMDLTGKKAE